MYCCLHSGVYISLFGTQEKSVIPLLKLQLKSLRSNINPNSDSNIHSHMTVQKGTFG